MLPNIGFDTAENGPLKVCPKLAKTYEAVRRYIGLAWAEVSEDVTARQLSKVRWDRGERGAVHDLYVEGASAPGGYRYGYD